MANNKANKLESQLEVLFHHTHKEWLFQEELAQASCGKSKIAQLEWI